MHRDVPLVVFGPISLGMGSPLASFSPFSIKTHKGQDDGVWGFHPQTFSKKGISIFKPRPALGPQRLGICIFEGEPKHYSRVAPPSSEYLAEGISDPTNFSGESLLQNMQILKIYGPSKSRTESRIFFKKVKFDDVIYYVHMKMLPLFLTNNTNKSFQKVDTYIFLSMITRFQFQVKSFQ